MKFNIEHKYLSAQTDSVAVAKRLILIIEDMEQLESGKPDPAIEAYLHDTPRAKSEFGAGDAYRVPAQQFKGAIVMQDPLDEPKKYIEPLKKRVKEDTPAMNITSRLHEEPTPAKGEKWPHEKFTADEYPPENNDDFVNHCIKQEQDEIKPADIEDEEIEIDSVPTDEESKPEIPHGQKIKSSEIVPQEGTVEEAYLGEHFEITPDDPQEKPLTPAEQELWDYIQANPNYTMQGACRALKITTANYYWRKRQLYLKGKPVGGTVPFAKKAED